jgi:hypothetical protein
MVAVSDLDDVFENFDFDGPALNEPSRWQGKEILGEKKY